jgi:hypothetical protein
LLIAPGGAGGILINNDFALAAIAIIVGLAILTLAKRHKRRYQNYNGNRYATPKLAELHSFSFGPSNISFFSSVTLLTNFICFPISAR